MAGRRIVVQFLGEDKGLSRTADKAEGRMGKLGSRMAKVGKIAALGLAAGVAGATVALFKMGQAAAEDEASQKRLAKTLENTAGATKGQIAAVEDWISAQGEAFGVADDELRPALEKLVSATKDVGEAQKLASLAMDISAGSGKSLEAVSAALMKAQNGQVSGLARLGVNVKDAEGKTISFEQAQKRLSKTFKGQAAASANTLDGKMKRLKLALSETGEAIGAKLLPAATRLAEWVLSEGLPRMEAFGGYLSRTLPPVLERIGSVLSSVTGFFKDHMGAVKAAAVAIVALTAVTAAHAGVMAVAAAGGLAKWIASTRIVTALTKAWAAVQWALNAAMTANPIGLVVVGIAALIAGAVLAYNKIGWFRDAVDAAFAGIKAAAQAVGKFFMTTVPAFFTNAWRKVVAVTRAAVSGYFQIVTFIPRKTLSALASLGRIVGNVFRGAFNMGVSAVRNGIASVINLIRGVPGRIAGFGALFARAGKNLLQGFVNGMKNAAGIIGGIATNVWSAVKGMLNGAIDRINGALEFRIDTPGPGGIDINPPNIPHLAKGGLVTKPTLALIGEDGPEAVVPLGAKNRPKGSLSGLGGSGANAGGITMVNQFNGLVTDPVAVAKQIEKVLIQLTRATGRPVQIVTLPS